MFIEPTERIIIMEDALYNPFSIDDLRRLKEAEIKTLFIPHRNTVLPFAQENFKLLYPFFYSKNVYGVQKSFLDLFNDKEHIIHLAKQYIADKQSNVQYIYSIPDGGEFLWDAVQIKDYPVSDDQIIDFIISIQKILVKQYGEIWLSLHNFLGHPENWNNTRLHLIYEALRNEFKNTPIYSFQFAHFMCGDVETNVEYQWKVKEYTERYGIRFFVGSNFCEGLKTYFDLAMQQKIYGFVTSPRHIENINQYSSIENWMVQRIKETNAKINHY